MMNEIIKIKMEILKMKSRIKRFCNNCEFLIEKEDEYSKITGMNYCSKYNYRLYKNCIGEKNKIFPCLECNRKM